jgi:hypothetical protein
LLDYFDNLDNARQFAEILCLSHHHHHEKDKKPTSTANLLRISGSTNVLDNTLKKGKKKFGKNKLKINHICLIK